VFEETIRGVYSHRKRLGDQLCRVRTKYMQLFEDMLHEVSAQCLLYRAPALTAIITECVVSDIALCSVLPCSVAVRCCLLTVHDGATLTTIEQGFA
jgi:hypothetical protein